MVVAVLTKIGFLLLKQLTKPVANIVKNRAKKHPQIRKHVVVPIGKGYQWVENKILVSIKGEHLPPLTEQEAVEIGADALGEAVLFGLLCIVLYFELNRLGEKRAVVQQTKEEEIMNLQEIVLELNDEIGYLRKVVLDLKEQLENPFDLFRAEEKRHHEITDHNFWDKFNTGKKGKKLRYDKSSPSM